MKILGIDEAGRGPVIGPMVIAGACVNEGFEKTLEEWGVKDSKLLTPKKRDALYEKLIASDQVSYEVRIVEPQEIDAAVESETLNLNFLEGLKSIEVIDALPADRVIVDCPSTNVKAYKEWLYERVQNKKAEFIVEHKADATYITCAAASIIAKTIREQEMEKIQKKYGNCGPGYPANELTQDFVKKYWNVYPKIFRKSWATYKAVAKKQAQQRLDEF